MNRLSRVVAAAVVSIILSACLRPPAASASAATPLRVGPTGRYLVQPDGTPFFISGDAGWGLIAQLRTPEARLYLQNRQELGFNLVIVRLLEHMFCSNPPNNAYGVPPFTGRPFATPNEAYFAHADSIIALAATHGITVLLAPVYLGYMCGDEGWCAEIQNATPSEMAAWGRYLGNRYKNFPNIIWLVGGDADPTPVRDKLLQTVSGIRTYDTVHLFTAHNGSESYAIDPWHGETWLTVNNVYSHSRTLYENAQVAYGVSPPMPFFLVEANYEHEHEMTTQELRAQIFDTALTGGAGHIFGNCPVWHFDAMPGWCSYDNWREWLYGAGSMSAMYARNLFTSRRWFRLTPDFGHTVLISGYGTPGGVDYAPAAYANDGSSIIAYLPTQRSIRVDTRPLTNETVRCWWYNPGGGQTTLIGTFPSGTFTTTPPSAGDWILVVDRASLNFPPPGSSLPMGVQPSAGDAHGSFIVGSYPNPSSPMAQIRYRVADPGVVRLAVYDLQGREIAVLVDGRKESGLYEVPFDTHGIASGVYFCRLSAGSSSDQMKIVVER